MVYIRDGQVVQKRTTGGLTLIIEFFTAIVNLVVVFFQTIFDPSAVAGMRSGSGSNNNNRPGGGRGGGGGGRSTGGRIVGMDNLKADHTARCGGGG